MRIVPAHMQDRILSAKIRNPIQHFIPLLFAVIVLRNNQEGKLQVPSCPCDPLDGFKNRIQTATGTFFVEKVPEGFEIHVESIHIGEQGFQGSRVDVAVGDHNITKILLPDQGCTFDHVFEIYGRLIISIGQPDVIPEQPGLAYNVFGFPGAVTRKDLLVDLRNFTILAEIAGQVASEASDGQYRASGKKMIKGFLFDGIRGDGRQDSVTFSEKSPPPVQPGFTYSVLLWLQLTLMRA